MAERKSYLSPSEIVKNTLLLPISFARVLRDGFWSNETRPGFVAASSILALTAGSSFIGDALHQPIMSQTLLFSGMGLMGVGVLGFSYVFRHVWRS